MAKTGRSGGKLLSSRGPKKKNRAGQAIVATARKIAAIYYRMVTRKVAFDPDIMINDQKRY